MPRLFIQSLTPTDPDIDDTPGICATVHFREPTAKLETVENLLLYLHSNPATLTAIVIAALVLLQPPLNPENQPQNPTPPAH